MRAQDGAHRISETASWPGKALKGGGKGKFVAKVRGVGYEGDCRLVFGTLAARLFVGVWWV